MSLEITEMFNGIKNGSIELQQFHDWLCEPYSALTDEEIMEIVADKYEKGHGRYIDTKLFFVEFARAILRKAQEK